MRDRTDVTAAGLELGVNSTASPFAANYELLSELGSGGMSTVYKARFVPLEFQRYKQALATGLQATKGDLAKARMFYAKGKETAARRVEPQ